MLPLLRELVALLLEEVLQILLGRSLLLFGFGLFGLEVQGLVKLIQCLLHLRDGLLGRAVGFLVGFLMELLAFLRKQLGQLLLHARLAFLGFLIFLVQRLGLREVRQRGGQILLGLLLLPRIRGLVLHRLVRALLFLGRLLRVFLRQRLFDLLLVLLNLLVLGREILRGALVIERSFKLLNGLLVRVLLLRLLHQTLGQLRVQLGQLSFHHGQIVRHHLVLRLRDERHAIGFAALLPLRQRLLRRGRFQRFAETEGDIANLRPDLVAQLVRQRLGRQLLPNLVGLRIILRGVGGHARVVSQPGISRLLRLQLAQNFAGLARLVLLHQLLCLVDVSEDRHGGERQHGNDLWLHKVVGF